MLNNKNYKPLKKKYAFLISLPLIAFSFIFTYTMLDKMECYLIVLILLLSILEYFYKNNYKDGSYIGGWIVG